MTLNKVKGDMYSFVNFTWNPIKGRCNHDCSYCYYQNNPRYKEKIGELRLDEKALKDNLGSGNFIFVGSSTDMFSVDVPKEWILKVMEKTRLHKDNTYLWQSKNTQRMFMFSHNVYYKTSIFGTTIETNKETNISKAPQVKNRIEFLKRIKESKNIHNEHPRTFITLEPIINFDLEALISMIKEVSPEWVAIGADSKGHGLKEPSKEKIIALIKELRKFTEVKLKNNLARLCPMEEII